jgi:hypothetical protein
VDQHRLRRGWRLHLVAQQEQWRDEPQEGMLITVAVPRPDGCLERKIYGKKDLGDSYTRWDWQVHYPINNYDVAEHRQLRSLRR